MTGLLGKYHQHLVSPTWQAWCFSSVFQRPGRSLQHGWLGVMSWAMHWNTVKVLVDQTSAELGQWSKSYVSDNITLTKQVFMLLAPLTLCLSPILLCTYHSSWHSRNKWVRADGYTIRQKKKSDSTSLLGKSSIKSVRLPRTCTMTTHRQYLTLTSLCGHTKHACLPPPPSPSSGSPAVLMLAARCTCRQKKTVLWEVPTEDCTASTDYKVLRNKAWETLKCFCGFHGLVKGVTQSLCNNETGK